MRMLASELPKAVFCAWAAVLLSHCGASEGPTATGTGLKTESSSGTAATTVAPEPREPCEKPATEACETLCNTEGTRQLDTTTCSYGDCVPSSIEAETCNGKDDDCDGQTDEDFECAAGSTKECETSCGTVGTVNCSQSCQWEAECIPPREICDNGVDDDCNGITDEFGIVSERKMSIYGRYRNMADHDFYWSDGEYYIVWAPKNYENLSQHILFSKFSDIKRNKVSVLSRMQRKFQGWPKMEKLGNNYIVAWSAFKAQPEVETSIFYAIVNEEGEVALPERVLYSKKEMVYLRWVISYRNEYWIALYNDNEMKSMIYALSPKGKLLHTKIATEKAILSEGRENVYLNRDNLILSQMNMPSVESGNCTNIPQIQMTQYVLDIDSPLLVPSKKSMITNSPIYVEGASTAHNGDEFLVAYTDGRGSIKNCIEIDSYITQSKQKMLSSEKKYDDIYLAKTDRNLIQIEREHQMNNSGGYADSPHLIWNATDREYAVVWRDGRDSAIGKKPCESDLCFREVYDAREVYFSRLDHSGRKTMKDYRVSRTKGSVSKPHVTWTGTEYSVLWYDEDNGILRDTRLGCK